jgi:nucleoid DNA-binding protein
MTRRELIDLVRSKAYCTEEGAERAVDALFETLTEQLQRDGSASLPGFGTFRRSARAARLGRNPRTGEPLKIKASHSVGFKPAKALKAAMQGATVTKLKPRQKEAR